MNRRTTIANRFLFVALIIQLIFGNNDAAAQQRTHYTQYMFSGLAINPAYAGADDALSAMLIDRHQWVGVDGAPVTQTLLVHGLNKKKRVGLGLLLSNDKIGIHKNLTAQLSYAYHLRVAAKSFLSFGLQAGILHARSDYNTLTSNTAPDPMLNGVQINEVFFDFGAGVYFRSPTVQAGIAVPELLNKSSVVNDTVSVRFKSIHVLAFIKYRVSLSPAWAAEPTMLIKYFTEVPVSIDAAMTLVYKDVLTGGASYRKNESIAYLLKLQLTPQLQVGYAYDSPLQRSSRLSNGSHELMVQYLFRFERSGIKSPRI